MRNALCKLCGKTRDAHEHPFTPLDLPPGCACADPASWVGGIMTEICGEYLRNERDGRCVICEHDEPCHAAVAGVLRKEAGRG